MTSSPGPTALPLELSAEPPTRARPASMTIGARFLVVGALVVADLWTKALVFRWMEALEAARSPELQFSQSLGKHYYPLWGEKLTFMLSLNPGAAFGQLDQWPFLLVGGRICAGLFLIWLLVRSPKGRPVFNTALVLVLAGALGNLYDNLLRARDLAKDGAYAERLFMPVRDFIDVYFSGFDWHFPTFNVADSCITVGAILLVACGLFAREPASSRSA